ncbi:hypothetical protein XA26_47860 [Mycolicibacterium fortuitum]|jgi:hypothetical protein|uniref:Secreted protein n=1 Tax=Mycolicibacterium fortuitum TaxID=1766 RepID=A0A0N9YFM0_MYCFO|nr:hypothetical protein [Mycolicibacterium fortuitum]ALI28586.1 hypothetical protein XA26_47860 [Mycolicibacterium fortuitum]OBK69638.1 hypothetical protein A5654_12765 [Mycolicibacterium fortuitum]
MAFEQITLIRVCTAAASAAVAASLFTGFHVPAPATDSLPNGDCEGAIYCVTGGTSPWVPNGTNPFAPWGTNASQFPGGPDGGQPNLPF